MAEQSTDIHLYREIIQDWTKTKAGSDSSTEGDFILWTIRKEKFMNVIVGPKMKGDHPGDDDEAVVEFEKCHGNSQKGQAQGLHAASACLDAIRCMGRGHIWDQEHWDAEPEKKYETYHPYKKHTGDLAERYHFTKLLKKNDSGGCPCFALVKLGPAVVGIIFTDDNMNPRKKMPFSRTTQSVRTAFSMVSKWIEWHSFDDINVEELDAEKARKTITVNSS